MKLESTLTMYNEKSKVSFNPILHLEADVTDEDNIVIHLEGIEDGLVIRNE